MLSKGMYGPYQIMAVTGHKSLQSFTVYQRVDENEKLRMGRSIFKNCVAKCKQAICFTCSYHNGPSIFCWNPASLICFNLSAILRTRSCFLYPSQLMVQSILKAYALKNCLMTLSSIQLQTRLAQLCRQIKRTLLSIYFKLYCQ